MVALEGLALSSFPAYLSSSSSKLPSSSKLFPTTKLSISYTAPSLSLNLPFSPFPLITPTTKLCLAVHEASIEEAQEASSEEEDDETKAKRKLFVFNLERSLSMEDIANIFSECGSVENVEIIKSKGYTFVTMATVHQALAAIEKFDSQEVAGRVLSVQQAKRFNRPAFPPKLPGEPPVKRKVYKLYVSNLAWGVRKTHLKEIFSTGFNPISARVMFPNKGITGFGFVGFVTKEEAEAALSAMIGKDLMGRPLRLEMGLRNKDGDESTSKNEEDSWATGSGNEDGDDSTSGNEEEDLSEAHSMQAMMDV